MYESSIHKSLNGDMTSDSISRQLESLYSRLTELIYSTTMLYANIFDQIQYQTMKGKEVPVPPFCTATASHNTALCQVFRPALLTAREYLCIQVNTSCTSHNVKLDVEADFLADVYKRDEYGAARCCTAALGNIVVADFNDDIREDSCATTATSTTNFGSGALATSTELKSGIAVRRGWTPARDAADPTTIVDKIVDFNGQEYIAPAADAARNGQASIIYRYVTKLGGFIAGPDGTDVAEDPTTGFGQGGNVVDKYRNYIKLVDFPGVYRHLNSCFSIGNSRIEEYCRDGAMAKRDLHMCELSSQRAFDRAVGQEFVDIQGADCNVANQGAAADGFGSGGEAINSVRSYNMYATGGQTKREYIECTVTHTPLLFYHNFCKQNALPVALLADLSVVYDFDVTPVAHMYEAVPNEDINILELVYLYPGDGAGAIVPATAAAPEVVLQRIIPHRIPGSIVDAEEQCSSDLITNCVFTDQVVHTCIAVKVYFALIRLWCKQEACLRESELPESSDSKSFNYKCGKSFKLDQIGLPGEYLLVKARSTRQTDATKGTPDYSTNWHANGLVSSVMVDQYLPILSDTDDAGAVRHRRRLISTHHETARVHHPIIQAASIKVHESVYMDLFDRAHYALHLKYSNANQGCVYSERRQVPMLFCPFNDKPKALGQNYGVNSVSARQYVTAVLHGLIASREGDYDRDGYVGGLDFVGIANNRGKNGRVHMIEIIFLMLCVNFILGAEATLTLRFRKSA